MKDNFIPSLGFVLRHECVFAEGHTNDLNFVVTEDVAGDGGGLTKYGIDAADHPGMDIAGLTLDQATAIYRNGEWAECWCDALPDGVDTAVFDAAVNLGCSRSAILLQRAIVGCGFNVAVDGEIGARTVAAAQAICIANRPGLICGMLAGRRELYAEIVLHHPGDAQFLRGWLNRVNDLQAFLFPPALATPPVASGQTGGAAA